MSPSLPRVEVKPKEKDRCLLRCVSVPAKMNDCLNQTPSGDFTTQLQRRRRLRWLGPVRRQGSETLANYHRPAMGRGCIRPGETEGGGLDMVMPVAGLMMGMALRARVAEGW